MLVQPPYRGGLPPAPLGAAPGLSLTGGRLPPFRGIRGPGEARLLGMAAERPNPCRLFPKRRGEIVSAWETPVWRCTGGLAGAGARPRAARIRAPERLK